MENERKKKGIISKKEEVITLYLRHLSSASVEWKEGRKEGTVGRKEGRDDKERKKLK